MHFSTFFLSSLIFAIIGASPVPMIITARSPLESAGSNRRGIPFNDVSLPQHFNVYGSHVTWMYNWDSRTTATDLWYEFVPMLHSLRADHTGKWKEDAEHAARRGDGPTHLLGFNEPDNCE